MSVFKDRCIIIRETSKQAEKKIKDCSLDFVFIDANHLYDYVKTDIILYKKKVKPGGIIAGHDYNRKSISHLHNTCKAVDSLFGKDALNFGPDNT